MNTAPKQAQTRTDWITRTPKWVLLTLYWLLQGTILFFLQAFIYRSQADIDIDQDAQGRFFGMFPDGMWGSIPNRTQIISLITDTEFIYTMLIAIALLTIAQMIFLLPVRQPGLVSSHGRSVRKSITIAGLVIGILFFAFIMGIAGFLQDVHELNIEPDFINDLPGREYTAIAIIIGFGWLVATPILIKFSKPGPKETALARLAKKLFIGTIIEIALLIPLDVMVRRSANCYCWAGTYWALTICGFVGIFALGPAVFLPILAKRRKTWYSGHCGVCGYDMVGMPDATRCPECGTGWRAKKHENDGNSSKSGTITPEQHKI